MRKHEDLRKRLNRRKTDWKKESRAETEEDVDEEYLFRRRSNEENHVVHISDIHEEDIKS